MNNYACTIVMIVIALYSSSKAHEPQKVGTLNLYYVCTQNNTTNVPQSTVLSVTQPHCSPHNLFAKGISSLRSFHKGKMLLGATAVSYGSLLSKLLSSIHVQYKQSAWATWKEEIPLEVLSQLSQNVVVQEILDAVGTSQNIHEHEYFNVKLIHHILQEIDTELYTLKNIVTFYRFIEATKLSLILPYKTTDYTNAVEKIERLLYIKNILENLTVLSDEKNK